MKEHSPNSITRCCSRREQRAGNFFKAYGIVLFTEKAKKFVHDLYNQRSLDRRVITKARAICISVASR